MRASLSPVPALLAPSAARCKSRKRTSNCDDCSIRSLDGINLIMLQPRISPISASRDQALTSLATALNSLTLCSRHAPRSLKSPTQLIFTRHASHAAQGRANGPKDSAGRRLGAKKTSTQYVIPGNIIFKQRGMNDL